jgi:hypothetical protein
MNRERSLAPRNGSPTERRSCQLSVLLPSNLPFETDLRKRLRRLLRRSMASLTARNVPTHYYLPGRFVGCASAPGVTINTPEGQ